MQSIFSRLGLKRGGHTPAGRVVLCLVVLCSMGCDRSVGHTTPTPTPTASSTLVRATVTPTPNRQTAFVLSVTDGDTIRVLLAGREYALRYIGINCPEYRQPYYEEATRANADLVLNQTVLLEKDVNETDRYGRLLRYVYVGEEMVNAALVEQGFAYASTYPPDVKHQDLLRARQREAQQAGRGLWAENP